MFKGTIIQQHCLPVHTGRALLLVCLALSACTGRMERTEERADTMRNVKSGDTVTTPQKTASAGTDTTAEPAAADAPDSIRSGFSGRWVWQGDEGASFELRLQQKDSVITGFHCAVTANARRVDCASSDDDSKHATPTISGTVNGRSASITFRSIYGIDKKGNRVTGTARIIHRGSSIEWRIEGQATGEHWLPFAVTLKPIS